MYLTTLGIYTACSGKVGKDLEGSGVAVIEVASLYFPGDEEEHSKG
jgi:hypothetical protein